MIEIPNDLRYTAEHEWLRLEGGIATVGITDYAQDKLGEVIYVELPAVGASFDALAAMAAVESVKAASDIYAPVAGEVIEVNEAVVSEPSLLNASPYGEAWLVKLRLADAAQVDSLLSAEEYAEIAKE